jgi:hypothetical protein
MNERKILGHVASGAVPAAFTQVLPANPRRLTLSFAGNLGDYNVLLGQGTDLSQQLEILNTGQAVVTFTRETLGNLIGLSVWVKGSTGQWCVIETWEG